jgi:acetylornithine deacetylase/succinyl-diaminopimelate desuccinylase-like protein
MSVLPVPAERYLSENRQRFFDNLTTLARIPSPSHHEERRAAWCKDYLESFGARGVYIDEALNVIYPYHCEDKNDLVAFLAHNDVVFPDTGELPLRMEDGKIFAPGIGDNTTNVTGLMELARMVTEMGLKPRRGILFVLNSCEEGLGNLKGARRIMQDFGGRITEFIGVDGSYSAVYNDAVGSKRYRVEVKTEGGHSYASFGNRNAIYYLAKMIDTLYGMKVPPIGKTTYNVGIIAGGTSVNTIAQQAEMLYEYRSDRREALEIMDGMFAAVVEAFRAMQLEVNGELVGDRPCKGEVDNSALTQKVIDIAAEFGLKLGTAAGSTDCNIPLSMGVPAVCLGIYKGVGAHTRGEHMVMDSVDTGIRIMAKILLSYFD